MTDRIPVEGLDPAGGSPGQMPKINAAGTALEYVDPPTGGGGGSPTRTINAQTGTAYTLVLADAEQFVTMSNAAASTLTIPLNATVAFPIGTVVEGAQLGAGQVTLTPAVGVTLNAVPGLKVAGQYSTFAVIKLDTDTWLAFGRLKA